MQTFFAPWYLARLDLTDHQFELFPSITPFREGWLTLDHAHQMHWQLSGNPSGTPVVWIHGGPGSSSSPLHRRLFDPEKFLIIQYDQRGCGQSKPRGCIEQNTTTDLVADLERLRKALGISRWSVVGGSWGAALALLYAQAYTQAVDRLLLRSPFLCTANEIERYFSHPPQACQHMLDRIAQACQQLGSASIPACSYRVFCQDNDVSSQTRLARAWVAYEASMDAYPISITAPTRFDDQSLIVRYRIHMHYLQHQCFVNHSVLERAHLLSDVDLTLIHGDQDALCPFENSLSIQRSIPHARLVTVTGAGHNMFDERMIHAVHTQIRRWE